MNFPRVPAGATETVRSVEQALEFVLALPQSPARRTAAQALLDLLGELQGQQRAAMAGRISAI